MKIIQKLTDYIYDKELNVSIHKNKINVINYKEILHFNSSKISIEHDKGIIDIMGNKLVVTKLFNNELLISGEIKRIELGRYNE